MLSKLVDSAKCPSHKNTLKFSVIFLVWALWGHLYKVTNVFNATNYTAPQSKQPGVHDDNDNIDMFTPYNFPVVPKVDVTELGVFKTVFCRPPVGCLDLGMQTWKAGLAFYLMTYTNVRHFPLL